MFFCGFDGFQNAEQDPQRDTWDNSYCVRFVIVSLAVNIGKLQSLVSEDNFLFECITISVAISYCTMLQIL